MPGCPKHSVELEKHYDPQDGEVVYVCPEAPDCGVRTNEEGERVDF